MYPYYSDSLNFLVKSIAGNGQQPGVWPIKGLDAVRGAAAIAVALSHYYQLKMSEIGLGWQSRWLDQLGGWGVTVFFVLSGFCIHGAQLRDESLAKPTVWKAFYWRRFFRLYPGFIVSLILCSIVAAKWPTGLIRSTSVRTFISHLLLLSNFSPSTRTGINGVLWSVVIECHFYLLYPLFLLLLRRFEINRVVLFITLGGISYFTLVSLLVPRGDYRVMWQHTAPAMWWMWCLGAMLADYYWRPGNVYFQPWVGKWWAIMASAVLSFLPVLFSSQTSVVGFQRFILPLAMGLLIISIASQRSWLFERPLFCWLGKISYSVYLFHPLVLVIFTIYTLGSWQIDLSLFLGGCVLVGAAGFYFVEQPMNRFGRAFSNA
jgi:peptidoglycan/LPS O-acetylase OafA/YrhL